MSTNKDESKPSPPHDAPEAGAGKAWPAPALPAPMGPSAMSAPAPGMGYGYQMPPAFSYPPQPMMMFPMPMPGGGGTMPMMAPPQPQPYAMPRVVAPSPKKSVTQVCTVHPDGMPQPFDVPFPEKRLPVCDRCKKNYRSRELCRQRDGHKALPWQMTYVVVTLTDEVLIKGEDGALILADVPVVAELQDMPELCRGPADGSMKMEPICPVCKEKNYTRDHCRNTLKHSTPPYQSIYVKLVLKQEDDNNLRPSKKKKRKPEENADGKPRRGPDDAVGDDNDKSDDITVIHESKTFFATISSKRITVKWCEQIRYPDASAKPIQSPSSGGYMMPPAAPSNPNMQYQLWDAFRAGAQWVQSGGGQMPGGPMVQMGGDYPMPPSYGHDPKPPSNGPDMKYALNPGGSMTNASL
mmetsp:Transcript_24254/g.50825  ORF Transcript_24254/g.50825 Transcript_24254/m.50825 type:complete len:409 (-) Transcript_24254:193-1419(-)